MHSEEREGWIGHRIHEPPYQGSRRLAQRVIAATKGDDPRARGSAGEAREPVRMEPRARDDATRLDAAPIRSQLGPRGTRIDVDDLSIRLDRPAQTDHILRDRTGDPAEVDDARCRRMQAADPCHVGLDLAKLLLVDEDDTRDLVRRGAPEKFVEGPELLLRR